MHRLKEKQEWDIERKANSIANHIVRVFLSEPVISS
jgi:hypothetical protein